MELLQACAPTCLWFGYYLFGFDTPFGFYFGGAALATSCCLGWWYWRAGLFGILALGSTGAAKEALNWLAMPSVMACTLGLLYTLWALLFWKKPTA